MGMFLRRGTAKMPVQDFAVVLSGNMSADKAYAEIEGVLYTQAGTHVFPEGTSITVFCYCSVVLGTVGSKITMNGTDVKAATSSFETIQFTFPLSGETLINFRRAQVGSAQNYNCDITTN